jgi:S1-C subfamily serine protease
MVKEFLSQRGIDFVEKDVSQDRAAAQEMMRLTRQNGVPVTVIDGQAVVGFDRARLEQILSQRGPAKVSFGAAVADANRITQAQGMPVVFGAYVGKVRPGSAAERLRLSPGDVIVSVNAQPVSGGAELERALGQLSGGSPLQLVVVREGKRIAVEGVL